MISIIDDDESIRAGLNNLVRSLGYIVHVFASAKDFLQSPQLYNAWCVIADVRMPDMSGVQLQSHLRSEGNQVPWVSHCWESNATAQVSFLLYPGIRSTEARLKSAQGWECAV